MNRTTLTGYIYEKLEQNFSSLSESFASSAPINHFYIDDLLPVEVANKIRNSFPNSEGMKIRKSLRELKFISAQLNAYDPIIEEITFAFQEPKIVNLIEKITRIKALEPDENLYAGGISVMAKDHFLNPHLDNSHDKDRERYRVLNLLYYVSPDWKYENGGNLELWPNGPKNKQITIESKFNRLVVMITNKHSWHSVSPVLVNQSRCCVSNYYFSKVSPENQDYFHVTSFRGRPEQKLRDFALTTDANLRNNIRKFFPNGVKETDHYYKK